MTYLPLGESWRLTYHQSRPKKIEHLDCLGAFKGCAEAHDEVRKVRVKITHLVL